MPKDYLFLLILTIILLSASLTLWSNTSLTKGPPKAEVETAVNQAKYLFQQRKEKGEDLESGPCLSNALMPNWALDIVHNPRTAEDDLAQNQCPSTVEGRAAHFVELDIKGNLVRIK